jgi:hypothetical protein
LDGGVSIIVGKNFDSIVKDADKDVLLEVRNSSDNAVFMVAWWPAVC